ncbi:MAG: magnesium transporter [Devosia sp.]|jgi:magnesium transporter|uniref:magnesium transporter n=1 Tax=unclassified Devosia TaxID=196773 RepID=UPI0019DC82EA|nr:MULTISPECIES: magnesium transporter [unclassified Devosia]MBF0678582.1 magnesium transporter [Devosia sp.]WEJ31848.1 magnesium transporter [Devosia sp. SD17-2]
MSSEFETEPGTGAGLETNVFRNSEDRISQDWLDRLRALLFAQDTDAIAELMEPLHTADEGDVIERLEPAERLALIRLLGDRFDYSALTEVDESVRVELMDALPNAEIARGVSGLDSDDAVFILEDLEQDDRDEILSALPAFERLSLKRSLDFPEDSAGRRMQTEFIAIPPFWTVGQTIDYLRADKDLPDEFYQLYVVDAAYKVVGTVPLDRVLRAQRSTKIDSIMNTTLVLVNANEDQEEAARPFERYDLVEVGVVDESGRLVGVLTIDDMVDVITEEADEDIKLLAGVGDEDVSDRTVDTVRSRVPWLVVNLFTALMVSYVIGFFNATIEQMVALAVLMPIVASMGGNAGAQTMTVTVRALAMRELDGQRLKRLIRREMVVGFLNGVIFAILIGIVTWVRYDSIELGAVIASAMVINMIVAGTVGILIPLGLDKVKADPAIASAVFVTTITDVVGFFAFLGIAGLWFGLF